MPEIPHPSDPSPPDLKPAPAAEQLKASELRGAIPVSPEELSRIAADGGAPAGNDLLGQERALDAIQLAIGINAPGYNVYVSGLRARQERETVLARLRETARTMPTPGDWVYVNNFRSAETPVAIYLKPGHGRMLRDRMRELINFVIEQLPKAFRREDFDQERAALRDKYNRQAQELFQGLEKRAREGGFAVQSAPTGQIILIPLIGGKMPESPEVLSRELEALPAAERERLEKVQSGLQDELAKLLMRQQEIMRALVEDIRAIERAFAARLITPAIAALKQQFENPAVKAYLDEVLEHMLSHLDRFRTVSDGRSDAMPQPPRPDSPETDGNGRFFEYQVNVLVDNSETKGAPVISEDAPSYRALFGTIERWLDPYGRAGTNFTRIIAGSFLKSHGGFLMFDLEDAIIEPGAWKTLKRSLKTGRMTLETLEPFPFFAVSGLKPEPIEISNKVVVMGGAQLYNLLYFYDQDFPELFKVKAEVRPIVSADRKAIERYVRRVSELARREGLPPFDGEALTRIVEFGMRKAGDRSRMLSTMEPIDDLARESAYFARLENSPEVRAAQVERALGDRILRLNFIEEEIRRLIADDILIVELEGEKVGQINGLAVMDVGGYAFGRPSRVTATVALGQAGVINIEREAHLSGSTHDKGVMILSGFMRDRFGRKIPAAMTASLCFEQSYSGIDGDSASSTELYALLSALSGVPIRQHFAVTGSVDQHGRVQAIGGVNEKIEGFYRVCKATGISGRQGVLIPRANVSNLMLDGETVAAVERGEFHIYPVSTIDQGIELLTGVKAGSIDEPGTINYLVNERFRAMAESSRERPYSETRVVHEAGTSPQPPQPPSPPHPPR